MKINLQINKMMIKMNKQSILMCLLGIVECPGVSWGVLGVLGCPGVIRLTCFIILSSNLLNTLFICQYFWQKYPIFDRSRKFWIFVIGVTLMLVANIKIQKPLKH